MRLAYSIHTAQGEYSIYGVHHLGKIAATVTASRPFGHAQRQLLLPYRDMAFVEFSNPFIQESDLTEKEVDLLRRLDYVREE